MSDFKIIAYKNWGRRIVENKEVPERGAMFPFYTGINVEKHIELLKSQNIFIPTPNSAMVTDPNKVVVGLDLKPLKEYKYFDYKAKKYVLYSGGPKNSINIFTVQQIYLIAMSEKGVAAPPEEFEMEVVGDKVVQTNDVGLPGWEVDREIYFKYFWLFYIVANDYWDKYPDDIYIQTSPPQEPLPEDEIERIKKKEKPIFEDALEMARKNYPEFKLAEEMVEEKKREGTYWSELEAVYRESMRLKKKYEEEKRKLSN